MNLWRADRFMADRFMTDNYQVSRPAQRDTMHGRSDRLDGKLNVEL